MARYCRIDNDHTALGAILGAISGAVVMLGIHLALTMHSNAIHERTVKLLQSEQQECRQIVAELSDA